MRAISLFSSAGIGELLLQRDKIDFIIFGIQKQKC